MGVTIGHAHRPWHVHLLHRHCHRQWGPGAREHLHKVEEEVGDLLLRRFQFLKLATDGRRNSARPTREGTPPPARF